MAAINDAKTRLLDNAEIFIQTKGFNDFSFRDLADSVGISSASVHHHYRTKEDLGAAVASRYTEQFMSHLNDELSNQKDAKKLLNNYIKLFRRALIKDGHMCLCGMLAAEIDSLPASVANETKIFFDKNIDWLTQVFKIEKSKSSVQAETKAKILLSILEGALILSRAKSDYKLFDEVTKKLAKTLLAQ